MRVLRESFPRCDRDDILVGQAGSRDAAQAHHPHHKRHEAEGRHGRPVGFVEDGLHVEDEGLQGRRRDRERHDAVWQSLDRREACEGEQEVSSGQARRAQIPWAVQDQIVIACAVDADGNKYAEAVGRGHISSKQCIESYGRHIAPGSYIVHDGIFSHDRLLSHLGSSGEIWKSTARESKGYMQPINSFCAEIERNLVIHIGLRDENLQDYLNWVVFRSTINEDNIGLKVAELESKRFQNKVTYRIKDRYRRKK